MKETVAHLNRYYHFTALMRDPGIKLHLSRYTSDFDKSKQSVMILSPARGEIRRIFFFFHGMDGDCGDGVVVKNLVKDPSAKVICMGGRGPAWVSEAFLADARQVIDKYSKTSRGYYLIGVSMGGTQVLVLAGLLPDRLKRNILGVITLIPGVNLPMIVRKSTNRRVKDSLLYSVDGDMREIRSKSPDKLVKKYKKNLPFVILYNENDTLLLSDQTAKFVLKLHKSHPVSVFVEPGNHDFTYTNFNYKKAFEELGCDSLVKKAAPILGI